MSWTKSTTTTKHTCGGPAFGRLTAGCPRCDELAAGAAPVVQPWRKRESDDARRCREIAEHFAGECHRSGGCGPVCTFGEW
jgi:hypothetical protein